MGAIDTYNIGMTSFSSGLVDIPGDDLYEIQCGKSYVVINNIFEMRKKN